MRYESSGVLIRGHRRIRVARLFRGTRLGDVIVGLGQLIDRAVADVTADRVARLAVTGAGGDKPTGAQAEHHQGGNGRRDQPHRRGRRAVSRIVRRLSIALSTDAGAAAV